MNIMNRPKFWKPDTDGPGIDEERDTVSEVNLTPFNKNALLPYEDQRTRLPIYQYRRQILYLVSTKKVTVIVGETGCGKSTQIPQYLYEENWAKDGKQIAVVEPRRVAAITVATRIVEERSELLGDLTGYTIRFDDCTSSNTRICFVTDGILVRDIMEDPLLNKYSVIILDEAHERTLYTDICIGLLKKISKKRPDLKVIIASATLDAEKFRDFFTSGTADDGAIISVEGRQYPVEIFYSVQPVPDYVKASVETTIKIHETQPDGDVLVFLTGQEEVETVISLLIEYARQIPKGKLKLWILPMYGSLPGADQLKVFERTPSNTRKVVVATNIAEASVTINGVVYVVDCGFVKIPAYDPKTGFEMLVVVPVSQASANQRAGRAGRVRSGKAYRLYPEEEFKTLPEHLPAEMQRSNMAAVILQLKALGIDNVLRFDFLDKPPSQNMIRGLDILFAMGAIDAECQLTTPLGVQMAEFPTGPMFSKMLLCSDEFGCSEEAVIIAAMMQIQNVFLSPPNRKKEAARKKRLFSVEEGDHITLLNVFKAFVNGGKSSKWCKKNFLNYRGLCRALEIQAQLQRLLKQFKINLVSCGNDVVAILRCITASFFPNAARFHPLGNYRTVRDNHPLALHPTSVLAVEEPPQWVVFNEVVHTTKMYMRDVSVIKPQWLYELAPHFYEYGTEREIAAKRSKHS